MLLKSTMLNNIFYYANTSFSKSEKVLCTANQNLDLFCFILKLWLMIPQISYSHKQILQVHFK